MLTAVSWKLFRKISSRIVERAKRKFTGVRRDIIRVTCRHAETRILFSRFLVLPFTCGTTLHGTWYLYFSARYYLLLFLDYSATRYEPPFVRVSLLIIVRVCCWVFSIFENIRRGNSSTRMTTDRPRKLFICNGATAAAAQNMIIVFAQKREGNFRAGQFELLAMHLNLYVGC